ncbi:5041_t:CDS:2 [Diversispora eburnea]|uniref:5041_t:CDS:1 n=1 Tax=Diversispora eburnea TaxID=1213867 RepID=A0A9N8Z8A7_9GLOM|nr:5041_t:CDS:2 [Diversispora eburnea]
MTTENLRNVAATIDAMQFANDIQETLGRTYGVPDESEAELDALGDELNFEEEEEPSYLQETSDLPLGELEGSAEILNELGLPETPMKNAA